MPTLVTTVLTSSGRNFDIDDPIATMGAGTVLPGGTGTHYTVTNSASDREYLVDGTGFTYALVGATLTVTGGTLTAVHEQTLASHTPLADFTGLSVPASQWYDATVQAALGNRAPFNALMAAYSNEFHGDAGVEIFGAGSLGDTLFGGGGADQLRGAGGSDVLVGGPGSDTLDGGPGIDWAGYDGSPSGVTVDLTIGGAQVSAGDASGDVLIGIENLFGSSQPDNLTGDNGANILAGNGGDDTLTGLGGDDVYHVDNFGDVVLEAVGGGTDRVSTSVSYTLAPGSEIEWLETETIYGFAQLILTGNAFGQTIVGNLGGNQLFGMAGIDVLVGSAGPDVLAGGADADEFLFDGMALANFHLSQPLPPDHVVDYNRSSGVYDPAEGDKIGLYPILSAAYGSGDPIGSLVYAVQNGSGADLRIDIDGTYNGNQWITIARLDGLQANQAVTVVLNQNQPLGATIFVASAVNGTSGDDTFSASGSQRINAGAGSDTIGFGFALTEATVSWSGTEIYVDGPGGVHAALAGFEIFSFTDGTVDTRDGNALVDDLFYYARNHDVWNAHADAEQHYDSFGWREGRDPNAWFSTTFYLALNQDVKAAGANPLAHYHQAGWMEARVPSADFDAGKYLQANPDVAAGHVDPLEHFLAFGRAEGRQPFSLPGLVSGDAFDAVYYLAHNPDVRAAEVDPHQHYHQFGWREGRDPNALFSTNGYLAHYADVAAAGIDPLEHYNTFGWHEGRDPSPAFDTTEYLAHYPDVAAAGVNPLAHYLMFGYDERRSSFADGVWG